MPMAEEIGRLKKIVEVLERAVDALEEERFGREMNRIEAVNPDDL